MIDEKVVKQIFRIETGKIIADLLLINFLSDMIVIYNAFRIFVPILYVL